MRPQADQFRAAASDITCADRSLFAATESNGNCFAALHNQNLNTKVWLDRLNGLQLRGVSCVVALL